ncbi:MAG: hypothetical protein L6Q99_12030 [Planctomycetes bacterium]|nr:hypothetical protein [Planctomycetota bacterium]
MRSLAVLVTCVALFGCIAPLARAQGADAAPKPPAAAPKLFRIEPKPDSAMLFLTTDRLPDERLRFVTCEAVLDGNVDFGVNQVKPKADAWLREGTGANEVWSYTWTFEPGVELRFSARPLADGLELRYQVENRTKKPLERVLVHPCLQSVGAKSFHPGNDEQAADDAGGRAARTGVRDYSELYARLFLWERKQPFAFAESELAKHEPHLGFLARGEREISWGWWQNDARRFDEPWIALVSKDKRRVLALTFDRAAWASSNTGDGRACFHLFGALGKIAPGAKAEVKGRLWLVDGDLETFAKRARAESTAKR